MSTAVEIWAPAFARHVKEPLAADAIFSLAGQRDGERWCNLCESYVPCGAALARHAREHQRELDRWRSGGRRAAEKANAERLRAINRERALTKRVLDRAPGDGSGPSSGGRHEPTSRRESIMASTDTGEVQEATAGETLFAALLDRVKAEKIGKEVVVHPKRTYARVLVDGVRNVGYVVVRKTKLDVYPQAKAADMPKDLGFKKCDLGSHHYGRGEVIVPVKVEDDFGAAVEALKAAAKLPAPERKKKAAEPKKAAAKTTTSANGNGRGAKKAAPKKAAAGKATPKGEKQAAAKS